MAGTSVRELAMARAVKLPSYVLGGSRSFPRRAASQFLQSLGDSDDRLPGAPFRRLLTNLFFS